MEASWLNRDLMTEAGIRSRRVMVSSMKAKWMPGSMSVTDLTDLTELLELTEMTEPPDLTDLTELTELV